MKTKEKKKNKQHNTDFESFNFGMLFQTPMGMQEMSQFSQMNESK